MDYIIHNRFDHIAKAIFRPLNDIELCNAILVCHAWKYFIKNQKFYMERVLHKFISDDNENFISTILKRNVINELKMATDIFKACKRMNPYLFSVENDKYEHFKFLWKFQTDKNPWLYRDLTLFHIAAQQGRAEIAEFFMDNLPNNFKNVKNSNGTTPLHLCAKNGHKHIVENFLQKLKHKISNKIQIFGNNQDKDELLNPKNHSGFTPLHYASENGHFQIVQMFLDCLVDKNPSNIWGYSALHYAAMEGHVNIVRIFMDNVQESSPKDHLGRALVIVR